MAFPSGTKNSRDQIKESGGQPLPFGSVAENTILIRNGNAIKGVTALPAGIRIPYFLILNNTDGLYYEVRCRNNAMGVAEYYLSDTGVA